MRYYNSKQHGLGEVIALLVERPSDPIYSDGILCYFYYSSSSLSPAGGEYFEGISINEIKILLQDEFRFRTDEWIEIPDQRSDEGERDTDVSRWISGS